MWEGFPPPDSDSHTHDAFSTQAGYNPPCPHQIRLRDLSDAGTCFFSACTVSTVRTASQHLCRQLFSVLCKLNDHLELRNAPTQRHTDFLRSSSYGAPRGQKEAASVSIAQSGPLRGFFLITGAHADLFHDEQTQNFKGVFFL